MAHLLRRRICILAAAAFAAAGSAWAQQAPAASTTSLVGYLGARVPMDKGPWVVSEVFFFSGNRLVSDPLWRDKVRAQRGTLYTPADIANDVGALMSLARFDKVEAGLYAIPDTPVPPEYFSIAASTSQVRLVFTVAEKATAAGSPAKPARKTPPAAVSGLMLTPTAYRGIGHYTTPGMGLDVNAAYFIGRLYGKNSYANAPRKTNYIDRLGVWLLTFDGKMQVQSETAARPAFAAGVQTTALLRDTPQPQINQTPTLTVKVSDKSTKLLSDAYFVFSKKFGPARASMGLMQGTMGEFVSQLSEFLSPEALRFYANRPNDRVLSRSVPFASVFILPRPEYPLGLEVMKFNGSPLNPVLINLKLGYFLKLNFDVSVLKYQGGYDVLGVLQFRYNHFPKL